jgi:hypothetical protein
LFPGKIEDIIEKRQLSVNPVLRAAAHRRECRIALAGR